MKVNLSPWLIERYAMKMYGEWRNGSMHSYGGDWSASRLGSVTPKRRALIPIA